MLPGVLVVLAATLAAAADSCVGSEVTWMAVIVVVTATVSRWTGEGTSPCHPYAQGEVDHVVVAYIVYALRKSGQLLGLYEACRRTEFMEIP